MSPATGLLGFLLLGLVASAHCAGMCGGFALAVALSSGRLPARLALDQLLFAVGKALTYVVLGLLVALLLRGAAGATALGSVQRGLAWLAGIVLCASGLGLLGLRPRRGPGRIAARAARLLGRAQSAARALGGPAGAFGAGVVTGFLPCGLSWSAFLLASQVSPATAAVGLFLFGLGTAPALAVVALGGRRLAALSPGGRLVGTRLAGVALLVFGTLTVLRGGWTGAEAIAGVPAPECCQEAAGTSGG